MASDQIQPSLAPIGDTASTAGYAAMPAASNAYAATSGSIKAAPAAGKYLSDPLVLSKLTDRVYELLLEDLRSQRERVRNYSKGRWL